MPVTLPGPLVAKFFDNLKQNYGLHYATIASLCGLKRQNITDLRKGRRKFTREMADRLLSARPDEPWVAWLKPLLEFYFAQPEPEKAEKAMAALGQSLPNSPPHSSIVRLPLLQAPVLGDPSAAAAFSGEYVPITDTVLGLADRLYAPYILQIQYDDYARRLRAGDWVLILQTLEYEKEIMVVSCGGRLSLARRLSMSPEQEAPEPEWLALESGNPLANASPVACVACIVLAMM
jgi:hypothetical protein